MKIAIIGAGNMGSAVARGLTKGTTFQPSDIICTDRSQAILDSLHQQNADIQLTQDNAEAVRQADVVL